MLIQVIIASLITSLVSLLAIVVIIRGKKFTPENLKSIIAVASGVLLASVFLELLPEVFEEFEIEAHSFFPWVLLSILGFYLIERFVHWHHCHGASCPPETRVHVAVTNLLGDGIHNFIDGLLIGASFLVSTEVGVATTLAIIAHEIPQEISDAGVLLYAGLSKAKVIGYNLAFALTSVVGAIIAYNFASKIQSSIPAFIAVASGNFIYLALSDLIPELHHERLPAKIIRHTLALLAGVAIFWLINSNLAH